MIKKTPVFLLLILLLSNVAYTQAIFIGGSADINSCYLGGKKIAAFSSNIGQQLTQVNHTYRPGFKVGFVSDFYPLKTKQQIFLVSINLGYQQYSQAISWSGKTDSSNALLPYSFYETRINRELYYSLLTGFNLKGFVFKAGITFKQILANSGMVSYSLENRMLLNSGEVKWPTLAYHQTFNNQELYVFPIYIAYNLKLNDNLYISPEASCDISYGQFNWIDFGALGVAFGHMITASVGVSILYSVLKRNK